MSKKPGWSIGRVLGRKQPKVGESSSERTSEIADTTIRQDTASAAQQTVDLYSTAGPVGIRVIANPADAALEYDPKSSCCDDLF
jgi:hypothetical protein